MNSFEVIFNPTNTHRCKHICANILKNLQHLRETLSIPFHNEKFFVDMMKDSLLGSREMYISTDQFLSFPEEQRPREILKTNDGGSRAYLYYIAPIRV